MSSQVPNPRKVLVTKCNDAIFYIVVILQTMGRFQLTFDSYNFKFTFTVFKKASVTFKKPSGNVNRDGKAVNRETKQTRSMRKDVAIRQSKPLPGPLIRYGRKSKGIKNEIKLSWTVSNVKYFAI